MRDVVDLTRYPLDDPAAAARLIDEARAALAEDGLAALPGFMRAEAAADAARVLAPLFETEAFTHRRRHNIYFSPQVPGLSADHPALAEVETMNRTLCADQIGATGLRALYEWRPLIDFLAAIATGPNRAEFFPITIPVLDDILFPLLDGEHRIE